MYKALTKEEKVRRQQERRKEKYDKVHRFIDGVDHKQCSICNEWLPCNNEHFYVNKTNLIDGYLPYCKECTKIKSINWEKDNPEKARKNQCKSTNMYRDRNREHTRKYERDKRKTGLRQEWERNNKDKLKKYGLFRTMNKKHEISNQEWVACKEYFNNSCAYCGINEYTAKDATGHFLHKEHVVHDGANDLSNCVPACRICNSRKYTFSLEEFYKRNDVDFNEERINKINQWLTNDYKLYIQK